MRNFLHALTLISALLLVPGCATTPQFKLTSDYDRTANFSAYRSFGFAQPLGTDAEGYESLVTQALKSATRREMEARGYTYTESSPDLLVNFNAKLARQTKVTQTAAMPMYYGYRGGFYSGWNGYANQTRVHQYTEGTLNIDLVDARRKQLVWEGVTVGRITEELRNNRQAALSTAVAEIFAQYPFRVGQ